METAQLIHDTHFVEAVIAPDYYKNALELMSKKKNRRILKAHFPDLTDYQMRPRAQMRSLAGRRAARPGRRHRGSSTQTNLRVVTERQPTPRGDAVAAASRGASSSTSARTPSCWRRARETVGIGAGQMSRVDASVLAVWKAGDRVKGSVLASDAFFPMRDAVDAAADAGVTAIIQPGRLEGRRGRHQGGQRAEHRDGLHGHAALQALGCSGACSSAPSPRATTAAPSARRTPRSERSGRTPTGSYTRNTGGDR